jgi:transcriptional regulator with XRE-family HTH domain
MGERLTPQEHGQEHPTFGGMLRTLRERQGLSGKELAMKLGVSRPAITQWELGNRKPQSRENFVSLLQILKPTDDEKSKLLEFMGMQNSPESSDSPDVLLDSLERRLTRVESMHSELTHEIVEMKATVHTLSMLRLFKKEVVPYDTSNSTPDEPENLG